MKTILGPDITPEGRIKKRKYKNWKARILLRYIIALKIIRKPTEMLNED